MSHRPMTRAILASALIAGVLCAGCGQKQETTAPTSPASPASNNTQYPHGTVQDRSARERPMPLNTDTGK